jgi:nitroreductase
MKILILSLLTVLLPFFVSAQDVTLPAPAAAVGVDLTAAIQNRTVARAFVKKDLAAKDLSTLLSAAIGKRAPDAMASATKAGRTVSFSGDNAYINLYVFDAKGTYAYDADHHTLKLLTSGDARAEITPEAMPNGAFIVVYTVNEALTPSFLKSNPTMFQAMAHETAGASAQNLALTASALKLSSIVMYNLKPAAVVKAAKLPKDETPLFLVQVGSAN